jgi:O-antigen ligase
MLLARIERDPDQLDRLGRFVLWAGFGIALILLLFGSIVMAEGIWPVPVLLAASLLGLAVFAREGSNLWITIALFVLILDYEAGLQLTEVVYGLYFAGFLGLWYGKRFYIGGNRFITDPVDLAVAAYLMIALASVTWAVFFGAKPKVIAGEMLVLLMMAFYFPVKEACARNPERALKALVLVVAWLGIFVFLRNALTYRSALASAEQLYEITKGRVALNEVLQLVPALGALVFFLFRDRRKDKLVALALFLVFFIGTIITQSRGYWAAFGVGALVLFFLIENRHRLRLIVLGATGVLSMLVLGFLFFPGIIDIILAGLVGRLLSLSTSFTDDISMVNRMYETAAVWNNIKVNPILGYGIGTEFDYFSLIEDKTARYAFVHNAYAGVWYKYGIIGITAVLVLLIRGVVLGTRLFRSTGASPLVRSVGLIVAICLIAEMLVANTSNPFLIADGTLIIAVLAAAAAGCTEYIRRTDPIPATTPETDG